MQLHFDRALVETLLDHAENAPEHSSTFGQTSPVVAALFLVGDDGVYLLSNGKPPLLVEGPETHHVVCYAAECNPKTMAFDDWWQAKTASFGADDGVELFDAADVRRALKTYRPGEPLAIDVDAKGFGLMAYRTVIRPKKPAPKKPVRRPRKP